MYIYAHARGLVVESPLLSIKTEASLSDYDVCASNRCIFCRHIHHKKISDIFSFLISKIMDDWVLILIFKSMNQMLLQVRKTSTLSPTVVQMINSALAVI